MSGLAAPGVPLPAPYYDRDGVTLYLGDCRELLPLLGPAALVVTDPPYNVGKDYEVASDALDGAEYEAFMRSVVTESLRIAPNQAWVAPRYKMALWMGLLPSAHMVVVRRGAMGPFRGGWSDQFETILTIGKPNRVYPDLWDDIRLKGEGYFFREETYGHPGYTPEPIIRRCISLLSKEGETVIDPFLGTGTTARVAKYLNRKCIGIEVNERYLEIAAKRLAQEVLAL